MTLPKGFMPLAPTAGSPPGSQPTPLDLVFLGSGGFGIPTLRSLSTQHRIRAIITQPDRPAGRGRTLTPTEIATTASGLLPDVPVYKPENINEPDTMARIRDIPSHAWVVIAFGQKLSEPLIAGKNAMNLHGSRLPRWRGAAPIHHAIMSGDPTTGNSVITIAARMDAGQILAMSERPILPDQTTGDLHDLLANDGPKLVLDVLEQLRSNTLFAQPQNDSLVTRASKLGAADRPVHWDRPASLVARQINGLSPWPGAISKIDDAVLKLVRSVPEPSGTGSESSQDSGHLQPGFVKAAPGMILDWNSGTVAALNGVVRLLEVQPPGKPVMPWSAYARGRQSPQHARFASASETAHGPTQ